MLSKARIKFLRSLEARKYRKEYAAFLAEGPKLVSELWGHFPCRMLVALPAWLQAHPAMRAEETVEASPEEIERASLLKSSREVMAVFGQREEIWDSTLPSRSLCLALDEVQDPGNLGTIVRLADWFGIEHICCSPGTSDIYAPKAVQATMGGLARVHLHYAPLERFFASADREVPVYGTFLDGENLYARPLSSHGFLIMGNEGKGISPEVEAWVSRRLHIPNYPPARKSSESLNVAVAAAIVCAEFRRQQGD